MLAWMNTSREYILICWKYYHLLGSQISVSKSRIARNISLHFSSPSAPYFRCTSLAVFKYLEECKKKTSASFSEWLHEYHRFLESWAYFWMQRMWFLTSFSMTFGDSKNLELTLVDSDARDRIGQTLIQEPSFLLGFAQSRPCSHMQIGGSSRLHCDDGFRLVRRAGIFSSKNWLYRDISGYKSELCCCN